MPPSVVVSNHPGPPIYQDKDEEPLPVALVAPFAPSQQMLSPPAPPELTTVPSDDEQSSSLASADTALDVPLRIPSPAIVTEEPCTIVVAIDLLMFISGTSWPKASKTAQNSFVLK